MPSKLKTYAEPCSSSDLTVLLLDWYDRSARNLPWRVPPNQSKKNMRGNPYHIWLSEVMLQQTTVATVLAYHQKFLTLWPTIEQLAAAEEDEILKAWAGLGYYSRARNLSKCAKIVAQDHDGLFPSDIVALKSLPGIGDYTANAIRSIAFNLPAVPIDGNIKRVIARVFGVTQPPDTLLNDITDHYHGLASSSRPGDFVQAMMDLGAMICRPKKPRCESCPIADYCLAFAKDQQHSIPVKIRKKPKPNRYGNAFVLIRNADNAVFLQKRASKGLLGGMSEVPSTHWIGQKNTGWSTFEVGRNLPQSENQWEKCGAIKHIFTHFHLELVVYRIIVDKIDDSDGWWSTPDNIGEEALPTLMKKVISAAIPEIFMHSKSGE